MQEITKKIRDKAVKEFKPVMEMMAKEGMTSEQIVKAFKAHCDSKIKEYYQPRASSFRQIINSVDLKKADSKAEAILFTTLKSRGIPFVFQKAIGKYRADYVFNDSIILELDGAGHDKERDETRDKYLRRMGYRVVRVPLWILAQDVNAIVDVIEEQITGRAERA